ncbi:MAG TPA: class I SAM-dependent methyltransferase [Acidimicrobiales bacterium]|nr:class I SAM-dependent methyltransferase [Acidimicrobiales bacterium]
MKILDPPAASVLAGRSSVAGRVAAGTQRRRWQRHAAAWEDHAVAGLESVIEAVIAETGRSPLGVVVDIGCGGGALALRLAARAERLIAVDVSPAMLETLEQRAAGSALDNIELCCESIEGFDVTEGSVDLVVSNYALHHLLDRDKQRFVTKAAGWLRPGGKLVMGDMMIGRGLQQEDRRILARKARVLVARGPGGWWRVVKNAWRLLSRTVERPVPIRTWTEMLHQAGFVDVTARRVVSEAAVVTGTRR